MSAPEATMTPEVKKDSEEHWDPSRHVEPAEFVKATSEHDEDTGFDINRITYSVPLKHHPSDTEKITVTVRVVLNKIEPDGDASRDIDDYPDIKLHKEQPIAVYLVGGPGSDNPATANSDVTKFYLARGFQMLFMDYRGMGRSTLLRADNLNTDADGFPQGKAQAYEVGERPALLKITPEAQAMRLSWFRQDNMVRDLEAVRKHLAGCGISGAKKWTIAGQSYGGWLSFTYLSFYPEALHMALITGGIPPVGQHPDDVYRKTYKTTIAACDKFYREYEGQKENVRYILEAIYNLGRRGEIKMPGGGCLTPERFLCIGRTLGTTDGNKRVNDALKECREDIDLSKNEGDDPPKFSNKILLKIESWLRFEERPLYAILQEAIYTGQSVQNSDWSAERVGQELSHYWWLNPGAFRRVFAPKEGEEGFRKEHFDDKPIYMSAEHVYRFHFDQYHALKDLKDAAELLAKKADWPPLFDMEQLKKNKVPVSSLSYEKDMFIDWDLSKKTADDMGISDGLLIDWENPGDTADKPGHIKIGHSKELMHTALKDAIDQVMPKLWEYLGKAVEGATGIKFGADPKAVDLIAALEDHKK